MTEVYLEGATVARTGEEAISFFKMMATYGTAPAGKAQASVRWSRLREAPFASRDEAWHWLHANAERMLRERVLAVRLLEVVEQRVPQLIAMFHEATAEQVDAVLPKKAKGSASLQYGDLPGDEWKRGSDDA